MRQCYGVARGKQSSFLSCLLNICLLCLLRTGAVLNFHVFLRVCLFLFSRCSEVICLGCAFSCFFCWVGLSMTHTTFDKNTQGQTDIGVAACALSSSTRVLDLTIQRRWRVLLLVKTGTRWSFLSRCLMERLIGVIDTEGSKD